MNGPKEKSKEQRACAQCGMTLGKSRRCHVRRLPARRLTGPYHRPSAGPHHNPKEDPP